VEEESEVHVFTKHKIEETVATRSDIKLGEQLTAVARRFPELGTIYNCIACKYRVGSWKEMC